MQIALPCYCKIEFGALSKDSITEENSAIAALKFLASLNGNIVYLF